MVKWRRMAGISNTRVSLHWVWKQSLTKAATLSHRVWTILRRDIKLGLKPVTWSNLPRTQGTRSPDGLIIWGKVVWVMTEIIPTKLVFRTRSLMCWPYVSSGPKGINLLGFLNYLLVSETSLHCCYLAPIPRLFAGMHNRSEAEIKDRPQALAVASLEIAPYWAGRREC